MSRVGIVDIGTNTVLCLKASVSNDNIDIIFDSRFHYRAGRRLDAAGNISEQYKIGLRRALLSAMSTLTDCDSISIVATEVLRKPRDGEQFARELAEEIQCDIGIIDPQREAELSYFGATYGLPGTESKTTIIDIGGGSSELAIGADGKLESWSGVRIGAVAISEAVGYEKPLDEYLTYADKVFEQSDFDKLLDPKPQEMIIVGGTAVTLAAILNQQQTFNPDELQGFTVSREVLILLLESLALMPFEKRKEVLVFDQERADIIVGGGAIVLSFLNKFGISSVKISTRGLRHGLLMIQYG